MTHASDLIETRTKLRRLILRFRHGDYPNPIMEELIEGVCVELEEEIRLIDERLLKIEEG